MKKIFFLTLLSGSVGLAQAQSAIPAGTISLGGSVGYNRQTNSQNLPGIGQSEVSNSNFHILPAVGYFLADNLALGLNLGYTARRTTFSQSPAGNIDAATNFRVGPYVQYYKMLGEQFGVLGTLGGGYARTFTPMFIGPTTVIEEETNGAYASLTPGIIFFPIPKFGISATIGYLGYDRTWTEDSSTDLKSSGFGASFGINQLFFGGTYFFGR